MSANINIDEKIKRFRLASRELFNHFFRVPAPYNNDDGWLFEERFSDVQALLFEKLVSEPTLLSATPYGDVQNEILVELIGEFAPIMINRDVDSGYWDYPIKEVTKDSRLLFISFFDWDQLDYRDNRYVRIKIDRWPSHPDTAGKYALIESQHVQFVKGDK